MSDRYADTIVDEVVMRIEDEIRNLAMFFGDPDVLPTYNLSFKLRLDSLYYRCRVMILEESVQTIFLTDVLKTTSQHMLALNEGLRILTMTEAQKHIATIQAAIEQCNLKGIKRLEVELRLIQVSFYLVLRSLSSFNDINVEASLAKTLDLCIKYPTTAGMFMSACKSAKLALDGRPSPMDLYAKETRPFWRKWKDYELGDLKTCAFDHPYSGTTFGGCPECGKEKDSTDYSSFLHEDAFLQKLLMMKKQG